MCAVPRHFYGFLIWYGGANQHSNIVVPKGGGLPWGEAPSRGVWQTRKQTDFEIQSQVQ
jgi:hypothetical protein